MTASKPGPSARVRAAIAEAPGSLLDVGLPWLESRPHDVGDKLREVEQPDA